MTTSDEDQNEEVARAMYGEALPGRDWMRCPDDVRQHWRRYARVALDAAFAALTTPQEPGSRELIVMVGDVGHVISDSDVERFWSRVDKAGPDGCWNWTSDMTKTGYGQFDTTTRKRRAHRLAYEMLVKPIPAGLVIDHLCRNRACVNPAHLEIVTHRENTLRGESPAAQQARQTHCKRGHLLSVENVHRSDAKTGRRRCIACGIEPVICEECGGSFRRDYLRHHRRRAHSNIRKGAGA